MVNYYTKIALIVKHPLCGPMNAQKGSWLGREWGSREGGLYLAHTDTSVSVVGRPPPDLSVYVTTHWKNLGRIPRYTGQNPLNPGAFPPGLGGGPDPPSFRPVTFLNNLPINNRQISPQAAAPLGIKVHQIGIAHD